MSDKDVDTMKATIMLIQTSLIFYLLCTLQHTYASKHPQPATPHRNAHTWGRCGHDHHETIGTALEANAEY
jgi:hypothetical protein